jgi:hypothetical protein
VLTQDVESAVEGCGFRHEALDSAQLPTVCQAAEDEIGQCSAPRGTVALFTDSLGGLAGLVAKSLIRDGYAVRLYTR